MGLRRRMHDGDDWSVPGTEIPLRPADAPTWQDLAHRAYSIYLARGTDGSVPAMSDWLQADLELRQTHRKLNSG